jgi:hypothetical protein
VRLYGPYQEDATFSLLCSFGESLKIKEWDHLPFGESLKINKYDHLPRKN